ncbi:MAG: MaoC/PaaZ C-terminal domain-containing protein [Actinomycetota bacterium]
MGLNSQLIGKVYPAVSYRVTAEAIRAYAAATNENYPPYLRDDLPLSPPTFPWVAALPVVAGALFDPELGASMTRLVHGEQEHLLYAPVRAGDSLMVEGSLESVEAKETGETFTVCTRLINQDGALVAELVSLMFIRGTATRSQRAGAPGERVAEPESVFEVTEKVDEDQTHRYAKASGDPNPIHTDETFARQAGLPGIILHGMCTMAFACRAVLEGVCGGDPLALKRVRVRFSRPGFPGDRLTTRGWALPSAGDRALYGFETLNARGAAVIRNGMAEVEAP